MRRSVHALASTGEYVAMMAAENERQLWVFAYGSLMWRTPPGVLVRRKEEATLQGFERSFCVASRNYRGTAEAPGLVLGLEPSVGTCHGLAIGLGRPSCSQSRQSLELIDAQEMIAHSNPLPVYLRHLVTLVRKDHGSSESSLIRAIAYTANPAKGANAPRELAAAERAEIIARAHGERGSNRDYFHQTAAQLAALGIRDEQLEKLASHLEVRQSTPS